jgi:hypothetical protein
VSTPRSRVRRILCGAWLCALALPAWTGTRFLHATYLDQPDPSYTLFGQTVAIDGRFIIVVADREGGRVALLYRRDDAGNWVYRRKILDVAGPADVLRSNVEMKNGIAAIQFSDRVALFEQVGDDYVVARTAAVIRHPGGIAISAGRVLIGGDNCTYDAVVYERGSDGVWTLTGRMADSQGVCSNQGMAVELNYDNAMIRSSGTEQLVRAWRRNGTALDWAPQGSFVIPAAAGTTFGPVALQKSTVVTPGSAVFRPVNGTWTYQRQLQPVDYAQGTGHAFEVEYRDGVLITSEAWDQQYAEAQPYVYLETAPGRFEHVAILVLHGWAQDFDVSGRTVVAGSEDLAGDRNVGVYILPSPLPPPQPIARDFDDLDASGLRTVSGQFALAQSGAASNRVLRQSTTSGLAVSLAEPTNWPEYQRIEADITPTFSDPDGWAGLVLRYADANNHYFVAIRADGTYAAYRRQHGVNTLLMSGSAGSGTPRVAFSMIGDRLQLDIGRQFVNSHIDETPLRQGQAGLATFRTRADFDNAYVVATSPLTLMTRDYTWFSGGRALTEIGGNWEVTGETDPEGLSQLDSVGAAVAIGGTPVGDQELTADIRLDAFNASPQGAWFGLVARYVDARNHFYLSIRSNNRLELRQQVDGVITVLGSVPYTPVPDEMHEYRFRVIGNQLQAFVDGVLMISAHSDALPRGIYGFGTYRTTATYQQISVLQP